MPLLERRCFALLRECGAAARAESCGRTDRLPAGEPVPARVDALSNEGGKRRIVIEKVDSEFPAHARPGGADDGDCTVARGAALDLARGGYLVRWILVSGFPEKASAFSPEDLYSNVLGTKIAVATAYAGAARSEILYERSADAWLRAAVDYLGPASKKTATEAMQDLDGVWWQSGRRLPDPRVLLRRDISIGETFTPWLVPESRASEALGALVLRECGGWPSPVSLSIPSSFDGTPLRTLAMLELQVDPAIASQPLRCTGKVRHTGGSTRHPGGDPRTEPPRIRR
jgi:hypothetical protein